MKNVYEVLRQKESDLSRVRTQVESLRLVLPLLGIDDDDLTMEEQVTGAGKATHEVNS